MSAVITPAQAREAYKEHGAIDVAAAELGISGRRLRRILVANGVDVSATAARKRRRHKPRRLVSDDQAQLIRELAGQGVHLTALARRVGLSATGVSEWARRHEVEIARVEPRVYSDEELATLARMAKKGATVPEIARALRRHTQSVKRKCAALGLKPSAGQVALDELTELAAKGLTVRQIAARAGRSYSTVASRLRSAGVSVRRERMRKPTVDWARLREEVSEGTTARELAAQLGISYQRAYYRLLKLGALPAPAPAAEKPVRVRPKAAPDHPDWEELSDAIARWGVSGAAEEYEVSEGQIMRWRIELCRNK